MKQLFTKYSWILPFIISTALIIGLYRETYLLFDRMNLGYILPIAAYGLGSIFTFLFCVMFLIKRGDSEYDETKMNAILEENTYLRTVIKDHEKYTIYLQGRFTKIQDELCELESYFRTAGRLNENLIREIDSYKSKEVA